MKRVTIEYITLHVGLGTFQPLRPENLVTGKLHHEYYSIDPATAIRLLNYKKEHRRLIAVGTTSIRALESFALTGDNSGHTDLTFKEVGFYISCLQRALVKKTAILNIFLFTGPNDKTEVPTENLAPIARRYNGRFKLLTTQDLKEMKARADEEDKKNQKK